MPIYIDLCGVYSLNEVASRADVVRVHHAIIPPPCGAGTRDKPLIMSAWEAINEAAIIYHELLLHEFTWKHF